MKIVQLTLSHDHDYLSPHRNGGFICFAHRGGVDSLPENTLPAFRYAVNLGFKYLETDVQVTADGVLVAFHDDDLNRTCSINGRISELSWAKVSQARVDGKEPIPLLTDLLEEFPQAAINIDAKSDASVDPLIKILNQTAALDRVCIGSFSHKRIQRIRVVFGRRACTSASPREVAQWVAGHMPKAPSCFQVPVRQGTLTIVTQRTLRSATLAGKPVHVWTIDDPAEMQRLIDLGVHGIMTDQSTLLKQIALNNSAWC